MTLVFCAARLFGALSIASALDAGLFGDRGERRLLITANTSAIPEVAERFDTSEAFAGVASRFDEVVHWNDVIAPLHPFGWEPREAEIPMLTRLVAARLGLDVDPASELVVESVAVSPSKALGMLIPDCPVTVYSDGLMSYGPTRDDVAARIGRRIHRLQHLDLVPGLTPLLLRELDVRPQVLSGRAFADVVGELPPPTVAFDVSGVPLVIGQYLADLDILTPAEELSLHRGMLQGLRARGHDRVVFAPHPAVGAGQVPAVCAAGEQLGVQVIVADSALPVERWFAAHRPGIVVSCFSTALFTAREWFGLPVATAGTELLLERLTPYQNSNRIPVTLVDATVPRLQPDGELVEPPEVDVNALTRAVGFCMQATRNPDLRDDAAAYLEQHGPARYFKRRRSESLGLIDTPLRRRATARAAMTVAGRGMTSTRAAAQRLSTRAAARADASRGST